MPSPRRILWLLNTVNISIYIDVKIGEYYCSRGVSPCPRVAGARQCPGFSHLAPRHCQQIALRWPATLPIVPSPAWCSAPRNEVCNIDNTRQYPSYQLCVSYFLNLLDLTCKLWRGDCSEMQGPTLTTVTTTAVNCGTVWPLPILPMLQCHLMFPICVSADKT